jgi:hypothetical protein
MLSFSLQRRYKGVTKGLQGRNILKVCHNYLHSAYPWRFPGRRLPRLVTQIVSIFFNFKNASFYVYLFGGIWQKPNRQS